MTNKLDPIFLIDSNVILDVLLDENNPHTQWSIEAVSYCASQGTLAVNQIICAEIANVFTSPHELETALIDYQKFSLPWGAAFLAGKAFASYRKQGGKRHILMPDFYIGAHAVYSRLTLVTRDRGCKNYYPTLKLITPD